MATFKFLVLPHQRKEDGTYNVKIQPQCISFRYYKKERQRKRKNQDQESSRNRPNGRDDIRI